MLILIHAEKVFDKIKHVFIIKTLMKLCREGNFVNLIKGILKITTASIRLHGERLNTSP